MPDDPVADTPTASEPQMTNTVHAPISTSVQAARIGEYHHHAVPVSVPIHSFDRGPLLIGRIPSLAAARQEREADRDLVAMLGDGGPEVLCQVLSGTAGVGKTQIAAAYARRCWDRAEQDGLDLLVWVSAVTRTSIITAFAQAGVEVCGANPADSEGAAEAFLAWLDRPDVPGWLVVLDDLAEPGALAGLWPPANRRGRSIVTTRRRDAALDGQCRSRIEIDMFTPNQAIEYLTSRFDGNSARLDGAEELAADLGYMPLALAQAAAFILDRPGETCRTFGNRVADQATELERLRPDVLPDDYTHTVTATLWLSLDQADQHPAPSGLASLVMGLVSLLDRSGIPVAVLTAEPALAQYRVDIDADEGISPAENAIDASAVKAVLARLHRLSLIDYDGDQVRVHTLLQRALRDRAEARSVRTMARTAADVLVEIWPEVENDPAVSAVLRANTARLREQAETWLLDSEVHPVLFRAGFSLGEIGQVGEAVVYHRELLGRCEVALGPDHPQILTARNYLAYWRGRAGDVAGAVADLEVVLKDDLRVLGPDHPGTFAVRNNLARWRGEAGDVAGAATALEGVLEDALRVLGPNHPGTLTARNELAYWRGRAGDVAGAVADLEVVLKDDLRVLGPDHPYTLTARNNLAYWRGQAGDVAGAAAALEALLEDGLRLLGPDHPRTLTTRFHLARLQGETGDVAGAVAAFVDLVSDRLRVLGPDHPGTLTARTELLYWRGKEGDADGTASDFEVLLKDQLRVLGPDHPDIQTTRDNLAYWREQAAQHAQDSEGPGL